MTLPRARRNRSARGRAAAAIVVCALTGTARGDGAGAKLVAAGTDPLEVGRFVAVLGDAAVLTALGEAAPAVERLAAVRAARWLAAPEQALAPLAAILEGRDSELAPSAARAVAAIAAGLDADALARREVLPEELSAVRERLLAAAERSTLRADIRTSAAEAAAALAAAGVK